MPRRPKRICNWPGCRALADGTYCPLHAKAARKRAEAGRPSAAKRGYGRRWQRYRGCFLRRHPVCEAPGCDRPSEEVDHIEPVTGPRDPRFWDPQNHQALCHGCHSRKTARENGGFGRAPGHTTRGRGGRISGARPA